jgi:kynurenine formamidase
MKRKKIESIMVIVVLVLTTILFIGISYAQEGKGAGAGLIPEKWWPSKWGAADEAGAYNTITPATIKAALKIVKTGKVYRLSMPYENGKMPLPWGRTYSLTIPGVPSGGPYGKNGIVWNDEFIVGQLGQVGTQYDGLGHIGNKDKNGTFRWYNGHALADDSAANSQGLKHLGVEKQGPFITRGVLIDGAGMKGVKAMKAGELITLKDLETFMKKAGLAPIKEGDAVLFNTGWIEYWSDAPKFNGGCPGVSIEVMKYLAAKNVSIVGADTWPAIDPVPGEDTDNVVFPGHAYMECVNGIGQLQNLDLRQLAKDKVYEFLFIFVPVPFVGATGSPSDTIAIQ